MERRDIRGLVLWGMATVGLLLAGGWELLAHRDALRERREGVERRLAEDEALFRLAVRTASDRALALAELALQIPDLRRAFLSRDRDRLFLLGKPVFAMLRDRHGVEQMHFHLPGGWSFLRWNDPDKREDDLSYRPMVAAMPRRREGLGGPELGGTGFFLRGVLPVRDEGLFLGSFEVGVGFGALLRTLAEEAGIRGAVFVPAGEAQRSAFQAAWEQDGLALVASSDGEVLRRAPLRELTRSPENNLVEREDWKWVGMPVRDVFHRPVAWAVFCRPMPPDPDPSRRRGALALLGAGFVLAAAGEFVLLRRRL